MNRKKWTPKTEITDSLLKFREKRKWQIALRRYILEQKGGGAYAPYFGLDIVNFRKWIELQFDEDTTWENFSKNWQFDHIVPVAYFDFNKEEDLMLGWNFVNIRIEGLILNKNRGNRIDVLAAKTYFETLYKHTKYSFCRRMVQKIEEIEVSQIVSTGKLEAFIKDNENFLEELSTFSAYEYARLNEGVTLTKIFEEREFARKF
jgi:hypothetical protein